MPRPNPDNPQIRAYFSGAHMREPAPGRRLWKALVSQSGFRGQETGECTAREQLTPSYQAPHRSMASIVRQARAHSRRAQASWSCVSILFIAAAYSETSRIRCSSVIPV